MAALATANMARRNRDIGQGAQSLRKERELQCHHYQNASYPKGDGIGDAATMP